MAAEPNLVAVLKTTNFNRISLHEKLQIKQRGRPLPDLQISAQAVSRNVQYTRKFSRDLYKKNEWICGCNVSQALYCFPCIMFGGDKSWTVNGVSNLHTVNKSIQVHDNSLRHMNNILNFKNLGQVNIEKSLDSAYHKAISDHNLQVDRNREVLSRIISCVLFCGSFELALRGHDETADSNNPGVFLGLINFTKDLDDTLKKHLDNPKYNFIGTSKTIQNELLDCMLEVCRDEIKSQIKSVVYLAVICDETTDISTKAQMTIVFRYVDANGNVVERFWGFFEPEGHKAKDIYNVLQPEIDSVIPGEPEKLVSQGYDGAAVISGEFSGVQTLIRQRHIYAHYIHCEAHQFNLSMERSLYVNKRVRNFFADLHSIPKFFSHSTDRVSALDSSVTNRIPHATRVRWNSNTKTVEVVSEHRDALLDCFVFLRDRVGSSQATIQSANNLIRILGTYEFQYWLDFFDQLVPHVDILFRQLQSRQMDAVKADQDIKSFTKAVEQLRNNICDGSVVLGPQSPAVQPRQRRGENMQQSLKSSTLEVCDLVVGSCLERFKYTDHLEAASLLMCSKFAEYDKVFPTKALDAAIASFPFLNKDRLTKELKLLYSRSDFRTCTGSIPLLKSLISSDLQEVFRELFKLLQIVCTMPMSTAEAERTFSTLKRIKTFLRNTMQEDRLSALAMLSVEKQMISRMGNFHQRVIEKFANKKERRMEFKYKAM